MNSHLHDFDARDRRRRERKIWRSGLVASVAFHLLIFLGWGGPVIPESPYAAAGPRAGDDRAAKGSMQAVTVRSRATRRVLRPPPPLAVALEVEPVEFDSEPAVDPASLLGDDPGFGEVPGLSDGEGEGDGGTGPDGRFRLLPPTPKGMIIPPANKNLKGTTIQVWVFVDAVGHVVPDSTRLSPPTRDRGFNQRLIREAAEWVFQPATKDGEAVASWFPYQISM